MRSCSDGSAPLLRDQPALGCADYPRQAARRHLIRNLLARLGHRRHGPPGRCLPANTPRGSPALVNGPVAILILHRLVATRHAASRSVSDTEVCESAPVRFTDIRRQSPPCQIEAATPQVTGRRRRLWGMRAAHPRRRFPLYWIEDSHGSKPNRECRKPTALRDGLTLAPSCAEYPSCCSGKGWWTT